MQWLQPEKKSGELKLEQIFKITKNLSINCFRWTKKTGQGRGSLSGWYDLKTNSIAKYPINSQSLKDTKVGYISQK